jgi:hypothetical protein
MKRILLIIMGSAGMFAAKAQDKCGIKKAWAYYTVTMPGMQMTDGKGNPVDAIPFVDHFIYIECKGTAKPVIDSVRYNNASFAAQVKMEAGRKISIGETNDGKHTISAKKGNTIWKIEVLPPLDKPMVIQNSKNINIRGKAAGHSCEYHLSKETQLATLPRY